MTNKLSQPEAQSLAVGPLLVSQMLQDDNNLSDIVFKLQM